MSKGLGGNIGCRDRNSALLSDHAYTDGVHCRESAGTGPVSLKVVSSKRVLPWQVTMDLLICASFPHTHCWYEVGIMLKVPAGGDNYTPLFRISAGITSI